MRRHLPIVTRQRRRSWIQALWMPVVTAGFIGYFGYHAFTGSFGIPAMDRLELQGRELATNLDSLRQQHQALETKVARLRPESLDADVVDVAARRTLNVMRSDEVVVEAAALR